jgi:hypothetical protein
VQDKERISRDLAAVVGTDGVVVDPDELRVYETDGLTVFKARPDIVVLPHSAEEVARVVEVCHREKCPRRERHPLGGSFRSCYSPFANVANALLQPCQFAVPLKPMDC